MTRCMNTPANPCACLRYRECFPPALKHMAPDQSAPPLLPPPPLPRAVADPTWTPPPPPTKTRPDYGRISRPAFAALCVAVALLIQMGCLVALYAIASPRAPNADCQIGEKNT